MFVWRFWHFTFRQSIIWNYKAFSTQLIEAHVTVFLCYFVEKKPRYLNRTIKIGHDGLLINICQKPEYVKGNAME